MITNSLANILLAFTIPAPSVSNVPFMLEQIAALTQRASSVASSPFKTPPKFSIGTENLNEFVIDDAIKAATELKKIIGEIREWITLEENWDGEGASIPSRKSINQVVNFLRLMNHRADMPQPMLHANGNVSLYWDEGNLYADIEFLGDGRIAYFIKHNTSKYKDILLFNSSKIPDVFSVLLGI